MSVCVHVCDCVCARVCEFPVMDWHSVQRMFLPWPRVPL